VNFVAGTGIVAALALMVTLPIDTWVRLAVWLVIGLAIFFAYARPHTLVLMAEVGRGERPT
jgi:basic amino acid/polyamine antiporter, APA family